MRMKTVFWILGVLAVAVVAYFIEERHGLLAVGTKAPDFTGVLSNGTSISLSEFAGKKNVVLFFYPKDFTSGCTAQACSIRDGYGEISTLDAIVFGVSGDGSASHEKFRSSYNLPFELIADTNRAIIKLYGAGRLGGLVKSTKRVTYVVDKEGIVRLIAHHELNMGEHLADVLQSLRSINQPHLH